MASKCDQGATEGEEFPMESSSSSLPTCLNLFKRKLARDHLFFLCHQHEESVEQMLLLCPQCIVFGCGKERCRAYFYSRSPNPTGHIN
ncbi:unnamed protein product [Prunus armeniaca]